MSLLNAKIRKSLESAYEHCNEKSYNIFDHSYIIANEMYESDVKEHNEEMKRINRIITSSTGNRVHLWNFTNKNLGKLEELYVPIETVESFVSESRHHLIKNEVIKILNKDEKSKIDKTSDDHSENNNQPIQENLINENWKFVTYLHEQLTLHEL